ncbi:MAG: urea ABC transporter ATP-binding protein UrtD [Pseudomonadota bacterium]
MIPSPDTRHGVILYAESVEVSFSGFKALDGLTLTVDEGELRCIIGPNGAGKSTFLDVVTGKTRPQAGSVFLGGNINLLDENEASIANLGIGRKFQRPTVFSDQSVLGNLLLALAGHRSPWSAFRYKTTTESQRKAEELLETAVLTEQRNTLAGRLAHGQKQWLELAMLLAQDPLLLLIDEPVAGMSDEEIEKTAALLQSLTPEHSLVVIEHDMEFVRSIAQRVTVLHEGSVLMEGSIEAVQSDRRVQEVYLGEC